MKKTILFSLVLMVAGSVRAGSVPSGITGLWRFQNSTDKLTATIGVDLETSNTNNSAFFLGPWTVIEPGLSDGGVVQERSLDYLTVNPSLTANGGGIYVNEYTVMIDYVQTTGSVTNFNSLFQTAASGNGNDGDLWITWTNGYGWTNATIGVDDVGFSAQIFNAEKWHRIVWSVKNGSFFRVYVDGTNFLDGAGQPVDGRFSVETNRFHLFADNNWEDAWGLVGTAATWNRALTSNEVADMGGWINGAAEPTPLTFSETPTINSVTPENGATNLAPNFSYQATILDGSTAQVDTSTVQLKLDGVVLAPSVVKVGAFTTVSFAAGGLLRSGSSNTYTLTFSDNAGSPASYTNDTTFYVQRYTAYEWRFLNGDLTAALGNGTMDYYTDPSGTAFGTTDGSTVPHINGIPAKYMHVPAFTLDDDGYHLSFNNTGPNVGTSPNINRYTLLFDMLLPNLNAVNAPDYIVPFFNTDPYNFNDADFYLRTNGSIGIGGGGYSNPGVITTNAWHRVAFVADLAANTLTYYVNGTNVKSISADGLGGRWALYSNQDAGPDLLLFNEGDGSGTYTHELYVSSVAFADRILSAAEAAALGGPKASGILVPSFTPNPTLASQRSGSSVVISWPSNYVGYALESKTSLTGGTWAPVPGVTNNAVNIPPGTGTQFFRLVQ